jgi:Fe-S-cluster containining protein
MERRHAVLHLRVLGKPLSAAVQLPAGPVAPPAMLPAAYAVADAVAAVAAAASAAAGRPVSCRRGCGACCRQLVAVAPVEAHHLAAVVAALPPARQAAVRARFADAVRRVRAAGLLAPGAGDDAPHFCAPPAEGDPLDAILDAYFALAIPCPFLEDEACSIYADRPAQCREYLITSPAENCRHLGEQPTEAVPLPLRMSEKLPHFGTLGPVRRTIPLIFAPAWAAAHRDELAPPADAAHLLTELVRLLDQDALTPFARRTTPPARAV